METVVIIQLVFGSDRVEKLIIQACCQHHLHFSHHCIFELAIPHKIETCKLRGEDGSAET